MSAFRTAIDSRTSQQYATRVAASFFRAVEARAPHYRAAWSMERVADAGAPPAWEETELYDIRGKLLFRDQVMGLQDGGELRARTAADQQLGAPVWSVGLGAALDVQGMKKAALKAAPAMKLKPVPGKKSLVCYSYPKLGLLCRDKAGAKVVLDLGDCSVVPLDAAEGAETAEAVYAWSPFDYVQPGTLPILREQWSLSSTLAKPFPRAAEGFGAATEAAARPLKQKTLPLKLHAQETNVYCAVATGQMILEYHNFPATQTQIAAAMGTGPSGTTNQGQVQGYVKISKGKLAATIDDTASFAEACREIDGRRPCKSGIPGHARACAGYKIESASGTRATSWLYIYDPWPPKKGAIYWENWTAVNHTNYIYVTRLR